MLARGFSFDISTGKGGEGGSEDLGKVESELSHKNASSVTTVPPENQWETLSELIVRPAKPSIAGLRRL